MKRRLLVSSPLVLVSLAVLVLISCTPAWMPDSSGFVYTQFDGSVMLYDVKTGAKQQITPPNTVAPLTRLAVSPDGKQLGAVAISGTGNRAKLHVLTFDLNGKPVHTSPAHAFGDMAAAGAAEVALASCYWSPDGKRLLAAYLPRKVVVVYEFASKTFTRYGDVTPVVTAFVDGTSWLTDVTPLLPDGSGILVRDRAAEAGENALAVIKFDDNERQAIDTSDVADKLKAATELSGAIRPPSWQDGRLILPLGRGLFRIDPEVRRVDFAEQPQMAALDDYALKHDVRVLTAFDDNKVLQLTKEKQVQVASTGGGEPTTLFQLGDEEAIMFQPSPDGRHAVLQHFSNKRPRLLLLDAAGRVATEIPIQGAPK